MGKEKSILTFLELPSFQIETRLCARYYYFSQNCTKYKVRFRFRDSVTLPIDSSTERGSTCTQLTAFLLPSLFNQVSKRMLFY